MPEEILGESKRDLLLIAESAQKTSFQCSRTTVLDPLTETTITHNAEIQKDQFDIKHINQELCLEIDHFKEPESVTIPNEIPLPPSRNYRTLLRFTRQEEQGLWEFSGSYSGKITCGELLSDIEYGSSVAIPGSRALDKALHALSTLPEAK